MIATVLLTDGTTMEIECDKFSDPASNLANGAFGYFAFQKDNGRKNPIVVAYVMSRSVVAITKKDSQ